MKKEGRQVFLFSLGMSLFFLLTAGGIVAVDQQGRRLSFGDSVPAFHTVDLPGDKTALEIRLLGRETQVDITKIDKFWNFLLDFSCIPHS